MASQVISDPQEAARELAHLFDTHQHAVFFGGAGVSTASGIPDFRSVDGLYHQQFDYPPETMLSHSFYESHPAEFFDFYRKKMIALGAKPNQAHLKLAELERDGKLDAVVTQKHRRPASAGRLAGGLGASRLGAPQHLPGVRCEL